MMCFKINRYVYKKIPALVKESGFFIKQIKLTSKGRILLLLPNRFWYR